MEEWKTVFNRITPVKSFNLLKREAEDKIAELKRICGRCTGPSTLKPSKLMERPMYCPKAPGCPSFKKGTNWRHCELHEHSDGCDVSAGGCPICVKFKRQS
jgi:hypothetical protein